MKVLHDLVAVREESCFIKSLKRFQKLRVHDEYNLAEEESLGRQNRMLILKSEDLPIVSTVEPRGLG